ncbi:hypothetical protein B0I00_1871 [Novosphingobium kunmingense]|uniref:Uncharacterized protein n=1 Tax=Novosphingobium kunmingense TaxID=1211806 RepID=A0A2N0HL19_9SPHN|nr:hypothetical protein [Novosphingobium kunmingense]PKB19632.1 hypothetical protein B0I00_1871 [Novosphingobium kunmingense]
MADPPEGRTAEASAALRDLKAWLSRQDMVVWFLAGFALLVVVALFADTKRATQPISTPEDVKAEAAAKAAAKSAAVQAAAVVRHKAELAKACDDWLAELTKAGTVRDRPSPTRIDVDEYLWAELPYRQKEAVLSLVTCSAFGQHVVPEGKHVAAYGWRDGKRKLVLTSAGSF